MSKDYDEIIEDYHTNHDVKYELRIIVDGEVFLKSDSSIDINDVVSDADSMQDKLNQAALDDEQARLEYIAESKAEDQMQNEMDERE